MRKLYYVITPEIDNDETTGLKTVQVYEIYSNHPTPLFDLELDIQENSEIAIQNYLDDNGMGDTLMRLTEL